MFLDVLMRRNPAFIEATMALHQDHALPPNTYVLDLDTITENAQLFTTEARKYNLKTFAMTKQVGRHPGFCKAVMDGGIEKCVAVDLACAVACARAGMKTGHLGHLVQIPMASAEYAAQNLQPDYWTVFNKEKAQQAAQAAKKAGYQQNLLARICHERDTFYRGHEGGFAADEILRVADYLNNLDGGRFAGISTFPALLYDSKHQRIAPTANLKTLTKARDTLNKAGYQDIELNAPGTTSTITLEALAQAGATQCEPGNGLHGTTPLHAIQDLPETPAVLYLSEVSHHHGGYAFCFGGGLYIDPVFPDYQVKALVSAKPTASAKALLPVEIPPPSAIDYYGMIEQNPSAPVPVGASVIFGFRGQAFVTRASVVGLAGIHQGKPQVIDLTNPFAQTNPEFSIPSSYC
ncbi:MAG: alanine racemase [Pseudomonadota bacterium]